MDEEKTFESRIKFINSIFSNKKSKEEVLKSSIEFKLQKSYEMYLDDVKQYIGILRGEAAKSDKKPMKILKKINKMEE